MKREAHIMIVCAGILFGILFVVPLVVLGLMENPLLACALVIGVTLIAGAMWLERSKLRDVPAAAPAVRAPIRAAVSGICAVVPAAVRIVRGTVPANKRNDDGGADGGPVGAGTLVPRPPGGMPPTLKAAAALPIPPSNLRAVSLSIWQHTPQQA